MPYCYILRCADSWVGQISPQVAEQPVAVCPSGIEAFSAEDPKISTLVSPRAGTPARPGNIGGGGSTLNSINAGLIDDIGAAHPGPLARFELPEVIQRGGVALGIEVKSTEDPEIPRE